MTIYMGILKLTAKSDLVTKILNHVQASHPYGVVVWSDITRTSTPGEFAVPVLLNEFAFALLKTGFDLLFTELGADMDEIQTRKTAPPNGRKDNEIFLPLNGFEYHEEKGVTREIHSRMKYLIEAGVLTRSDYDVTVDVTTKGKKKALIIFSGNKRKARRRCMLAVEWLGLHTWKLTGHEEYRIARQFSI
jgi:hypothetical protein